MKSYSRRTLTKASCRTWSSALINEKADRLARCISASRVKCPIGPGPQICFSARVRTSTPFRSTPGARTSHNPLVPMGGNSVPAGPVCAGVGARDGGAILKGILLQGYYVWRGWSDASARPER